MQHPCIYYALLNQMKYYNHFNLPMMVEQPERPENLNEKNHKYNGPPRFKVLSHIRTSWRIFDRIHLASIWGQLDRAVEARNHSTSYRGVGGLAVSNCRKNVGIINYSSSLSIFNEVLINRRHKHASVDARSSRTRLSHADGYSL